ncbi:MAG: polysaccharide deacetylase family protein [Clostridia bacterium]|nr:polysaccharide deacetylase family protein [Clostridia bacterium]
MKILFSYPLRKHTLLAAVSLAVAATVLFTAILVYAPQTVAPTAATARRLPIYCTDRDDRVVSLTFDAAWGDEDTPLLIDILAQYDVKATFFVVGEWVDRCPASVKALHEAGHEVMNHSDSHPHMPSLSAEEMKAELENCNRKIEAITGVRPVLHRFPYGDYSNEAVAAVEDLGMYAVQWDVDSLDWKDLSADEITKRVISRVQSGSIVLFHNAALHTPEALPAILEQLTAEGYTFCKASDMIYREGYTINHEGRQCKNEPIG